MNSTNEQPVYASSEAYGEIIKTLHAFTWIILWGLMDDTAGLRERVIRGFIARGMTCVESIQVLWHLRHYQDCYSLYRCLLDRLFYLYVLNRDGSFEEFDNWSFLEQFRGANYARSHPEFRSRTSTHVFTDAEKKRYKALLHGATPRWSRPDPKAVSKEMGLQFLYHLGYDYASRHVHPMANDGEEDFERITMLRREPGVDHRSVLSNSILIQLLLIQNGLNSSSLQWRRLIYDFLDHCREFLVNGSLQYMETFLKIGEQGPDYVWAKRLE